VTRRLLLLLLLVGCTPTPETFVHPELTGGHAELACADCHGEVLQDIPPGCEDCHDRPANHYDGACGSCHGILDWTADVVDHDRFFPTPHQGVSDCGDCHPSAASSNFEPFTCTDCHAHRRGEMDGEHIGEVAGYRYESNACLDCHPRGREEDD
jgi:hypothetical protein